jgi:hypothetical protein
MLSVRDELALVTVRRNEMLSRLHGPVSTALWPRLLKGWKVVEAAKGAARRAAALEAFSELIRRGASDKEGWRDVRHVIDQRVRICCREIKHTVRERDTVPRDDFMHLAAAVCGMVLRQVRDDPQALAQLTKEFDLLLGRRRPAPARPPAEGGAGVDAALGGAAEGLAAGPPPAPGGPGIGTGAAGRPLCGAKSRAGGTCRKPPAPGRTRCRLHGGASPRGSDHPRFVHGRYSRLLPQNMRAQFERLLAAPERSVRDAIDLVRSRRNELLATLEGSDAARLWKELLARWAAYEAAEAGPDRGARQAAGQALAEVIRRGAKEDRLWEQIAGLGLLAGKLCNAEWRRMRAMGEIMTPDEAMTLGLALCYPVQRYVKPKVRVGIAKEVEELLRSIREQRL